MGVKDEISSIFFNIVKRQVTRKMAKASLVLNTTNVNGDIIEYWDTNSSKPVLVLIHGFGATTEYQWFSQVDFLSKKYRLILPNLFHFGKSKPKTEKYQIANQVEMVHDLLQSLKIGNYTVCGLSYGGLVAIELVNLYEKEVEKLIVFDTPIKFMKEEDIEKVCEVFNAESLEKLFVPDNEKGIKSLMWLASGKKSKLPSFLFKSYFKKLYSHNLEDKRRVMKSLIDSLEKYSKQEYYIEIPILIIWGSNDLVVPKSRGKLLAKYLGDNAEFKLIEGGAHLPNISNTNEFNLILSEFLNRN